MFGAAFGNAIGNRFGGGQRRPSIGSMGPAQKGLGPSQLPGPMMDGPAPVMGPQPPEMTMNPIQGGQGFRPDPSQFLNLMNQGNMKRPMAPSGPMMERIHNRRPMNPMRQPPQEIMPMEQSMYPR